MPRPAFGPLVDYSSYSDKYFIRSLHILQKDNLNPWVRAQVFTRKGPGIVAGTEKAVSFLKENTGIMSQGGRIYCLPDNSEFQPKETLLIIEAPIQSFIVFETIYLGILSAALTLANGGVSVDLDSVTERARSIKEFIGLRTAIYMGARHWHYKMDPLIAKAAYYGGFTKTSTDAGAETFGDTGTGTIPHALENIYAWKYGMDNAVVESTKAFDRYIDPSIPRIALVDYNNREIDDALKTAEALEGRLWGVRLDTCGENICQGAEKESSRDSKGHEVLKSKYWAGHGVTISGAVTLREALDKNGFRNVKIVLSSGFGNPEKVKEFVKAEVYFQKTLFDAIGAGQLFDSWTTTMDIVGIAETKGSPWENISKVGRSYRPNDRLVSA